LKKQLRLIADEPVSGSLNMGIDSAIVQSVAEGESMPVLRLYSWINPVVTVGYFQKVSDTVNTCYCRKNNIDVIRRITGGGTVLHNKEITYSFIAPVKNSFLPEDLISSFKAIIDPIIISLQKMRIDAVFKPVNDILVDNKKISGSAQTRKHGVLLQHGTILTGIDKDIFEGALIFDFNKLNEKGVTEPLDLVTSVKNILGDKFNQDTACSLNKSIIDNFSKVLNMEIVEKNLSARERTAAYSYMNDIFEKNEWNMKR
jgi:lipoate-protein ligase A